MEPHDGISRCETCRSKFAEYGRKRLANRTTEQRLKTNAADVARKQRRREAGLCTDCGDPVTGGTGRCDECKKTFLEYGRTRRSGRTDEQRQKENADNNNRIRALIEQGLCIYCKEPAEAGKTGCRPCLDKKAEGKRVKRAERKNLSSQDPTE